MSRSFEKLPTRESRRHINNMEASQGHTFVTEAKFCIRKEAMLVESLHKQAIGMKSDNEEEEASENKTPTVCRGGTTIS